MTASTFDPAVYKETTRVQWQDAADGVAPLGPGLRPLARRRDAADARPRGASVRGHACSTSPPARAGRRSPRPARGARRARDRHLVEHPRRGCRRGTCGRSVERRDAGDGRRVARRRARFVRRGDLTARAHVPAGQARARSPRKGRVAPGRPLRGDRLLRAGARTGSSRCRSRSSARTPSCRRPAPGLPGPFSATNLGELLEGAGFRDVEVQRRRGAAAAWQRSGVHPARARVVRSAAPDARRASTRRPRTRPGPRSRRRWASSKARPASPARANCSSAQGRSSSRRAASWPPDSLPSACT